MVSGCAGYPLFSSLLPLSRPPRAPACAPLHSQPRRASNRDTRLATFRFCLPARPLLRFHDGEVAWSAGYSASGRRGPDGAWGAELAHPQSPLAHGLGQEWLAVGGKRDLGQSGWHPPPPSKNRFWMDNCISQSEQEEGRAPPRPRLFPALRERGRGQKRSRATGTRSPRVAWACGALAGGARLSSRVLARRASLYTCPLHLDSLS